MSLLCTCSLLLLCCFSFGLLVLFVFLGWMIEPGQWIITGQWQTSKTGIIVSTCPRSAARSPRQISAHFGGLGLHSFTWPHNTLNTAHSKQKQSPLCLSSRKKSFFSAPRSCPCPWPCKSQSCHLNGLAWLR